jgi:bacterioferritin-associated ferredoxin
MNNQYAVIMVDSTSHAMRIEHVLAMAKLETKMIPVPRHLSSDCGVCVRVLQEDMPAIRQQLNKNKVAYNEIVKI